MEVQVESLIWERFFRESGEILLQSGEKYFQWDVSHVLTNRQLGFLVVITCQRLGGYYFSS